MTGLCEEQVLCEKLTNWSKSLWKEHRYPICLLLLLVVGFALRTYRLTWNSLWCDEGFSVSLSAGPVDEVIVGTVTDQHPPLFYILLHGWMLLLGDGMFIIRFFPVVFGMASIALIYRMARDLFTPTVGLVSAFLLAVSPAHIWYSQEVRMYSLLVLLVMSSAYLNWRSLAKPTRCTSLSYIVITLLALYTHSFALIILAFENVFTIVLLASKRHYDLLVKWLIAQSVVVLAFLPWLPILIMQAKYHRTPWIHAHPPLIQAGGTLLYLTMGISDAGDARIYPGIAWLTCVVLVAAVSALRQRSQMTLFFAFAWLLVPFAIILGVSLWHPIAQLKQFLIVLPALLMICAWSIEKFRQPWLRAILLVSLLALLSFSLHQQFFVVHKQQWRELARYIEAYAEAKDVIYLNPATGALTLNYYLKSDLPQEGYPTRYDVHVGGYAGQVTTPQTVDAVFGQLVARYNRIWLIQFASDFWDPEGLIPAWLDRHAMLVATPSFSGLDVRVYDLAR